MLLDAIFSGDLRTILMTICLALPAVVLCLTIHECAHGLTARLLGDRTAEQAGRLTLDPMAHIDPVGFLCMLLFGFGWARPVPVRVSGFRIKNRKIGMALVAFAGPLSNLVIAIPLLMASFALYSTENMFLQSVRLFLQYAGLMSVGLGVFNLIPVYPLDGSHILDAFLPFRLQVKMQRYQSVILLVLIALIWFGGFDLIIAGAQQLVANWALQLDVLLGLI